MSLVGTQSTVALPNTGVITINGSVYALVRQTTFSSGRKQDEKKIAGTDVPWILNHTFHGEGFFDILLSTDSALLLQQLVKPVNGVVPQVTVSWKVSDAQGNSVTQSAGVFPQSLETTVPAGHVVKAKLSFVMGSSPGSSQGSPIPSAPEREQGLRSQEAQEAWEDCHT